MAELARRRVPRVAVVQHHHDGPLGRHLSEQSGRRPEQPVPLLLGTASGHSVPVRARSPVVDRPGRPVSPAPASGPYGVRPFVREETYALHRPQAGRPRLVTADAALLVALGAPAAYAALGERSPETVPVTPTRGKAYVETRLFFGTERPDGGPDVTDRSSWPSSTRR